MDSLHSPTKTKMKPSYYEPKSFHGVRTISAISALVVTGIMVFFCIELKNDGYKIPWTFLICGLTSIVTILVLILTLCIHTCTRLSPIFNLVLNVPLLILWIISLALMGWNIFGTLAHSCSTTSWGNDDGIMICNQFKAVFSFIVFGTLSQIAAIVVDVRARFAQNRGGHYAKMRDSTSDVKLEPFDSTHSHSVQSSVHDIPYQDSTNQYRDEPGWRPGQRTNTSTVAGSDYGDIAGREGQQQVRMDHFSNHNNQYHAPAQGTGYDSRYGQQNFVPRY